MFKCHLILISTDRQKNSTSIKRKNNQKSKIKKISPFDYSINLNISVKWQE